jgi:CheY-like chemotaxis protein
MAQLLLVGEASTLGGCRSMLQTAGHDVLTTSSGQQALDLLGQQRIDLVIAELHLRGGHAAVPFIVVVRDSLLQSVAATVDAMAHEAARTAPSASASADLACLTEAHAAARWARALAPITRSAKDPRTITNWSQLVSASPGALRNWCRTAGVSARRSLVFARLLRVATLSQGGRHRPQDLLDVVDRRTLVGLMKYAGLDPARPFPAGPDEFLQQQALVRDPTQLHEIKRALRAAQRPPATAAASGSEAARSGAANSASRRW